MIRPGRALAAILVCLPVIAFTQSAPQPPTTNDPFPTPIEATAGVIAVNYQENAARIQPFLDRMRLDLTVVRDHDGSVRDAWDVNVFPTTFVVNPNQRISLVAVGEIDWDDAQVEARIRELGGRPRTVAERR